ncbi:MAG: hypothetical protein H7Y88_05705 [Phycisphaerales bacterium]|nr:hypothetical protein [Phycisphaerales bacterium]
MDPPCLVAPAPRCSNAWRVEIAQLLEEHHLVAWAHSARERLTFGADLATYLTSMADTEVCRLDGKYITDLESFVHQLQRVVHGPVMRLEIDGPRGVVAQLRRRDLAGPPGRALKRRYYIWQDADMLLRKDHRLFGKLVDALLGVAAEAEYASEDLLLIHRAVFVGAPSLDMYAEDNRGQFASWATEAGEEALWEVISGVERPPVLRFKIDRELCGSPE